jgi:hypothetical protein
MTAAKGQPNTLAIAAARPVWASETTSCTPSSPRARSQALQERPPEALGLGLADVQTDDLAPAGLVHAVGDHQGLVAYPAWLADPLHLGVQPQIRVGTSQRPLIEDGDLLIQAAAQPGDLVLGHPAQAQLFDQPVDLAGRHPIDKGLLDHRDQNLFGPPARLQEAREIRPGPQLGDGQLQLSNPGVPPAGPIAVALRLAGVGRALARLRPGQRGHLRLHQLGDQPGHALTEHVSVLVTMSLSTRSAAVILWPSAIVASPSSILGQTDDHEARGGRTHSQPSGPCYTTLRASTTPSLSGDEVSTRTATTAHRMLRPNPTACGRRISARTRNRSPSTTQRLPIAPDVEEYGLWTIRRETGRRGGSR